MIGRQNSLISSKMKHLKNTLPSSSAYLHLSQNGSWQTNGSNKCQQEYKNVRETFADQGLVSAVWIKNELLRLVLIVVVVARVDIVWCVLRNRKSLWSFKPELFQVMANASKFKSVTFSWAPVQSRDVNNPKIAVLHCSSRPKRRALPGWKSCNWCGYIARSLLSRHRFSIQWRAHLVPHVQ